MATDITKQGEILNSSGNINGWTDVNLDATVSTLLTDSMIGIHGMPYQWMDSVDARLPGTTFGRKYAQKIVSRMPLLYLTPGRPSFMGDFSSMDKDNLLLGLINKSSDAKSVAEQLMGGTGKYYSFDFKYDQYFAYVNPMCQIMAKLMNVDNYAIKLGKTDNIRLGNADWSKALSDDFSTYFFINESIPFYVDSEVTVSDSFDNDVTESWLESQTQSIQDQVKELDFLMGSSNGSNTDMSAAVDSISTGFISQFSKFSSAQSLLKGVTNSLSSIAAGGKLSFPKIWSDGSLSRSYSVNIKLRSPDCDNLSIYLNVMVPFLHLLGLVAPQMMVNNVNAYSAPFIIRAFFRSMFNIDMGLITSMSVSKGKEGGWNANGIPTEMDISLTIKDLYETFCISGFSDSTGIKESIKSFFGSGNDSVMSILKNTSMMDYLSNMAGLNMNKPSVLRNVEIYTMLKGNQTFSYPQRKLLQLQQAVDNSLIKIYKPGS